ncbi:ankyrin repeat domain-containing protein [Neochlamydia sp. TUME1]|uniref:ankyrin repeat domain-containing protein n=1 Tax=Neochlamydia sp. TUME1 TaxID=1478174 RepID=UPI00057E054C|nr:ankyrin repeat domain-containing protein [Neochlamydia sp. TUME1]
MEAPLQSKPFYVTPEGKEFSLPHVKLNTKKDKKWAYKPHADYRFGDSHLFYACRSNQKEATLFFLKKMTNWVLSSPPVNIDNESIIHLACHNGDVDILRSMLEHCRGSPGINKKNAMGRTPLAILVEKANRLGVMTLLVHAIRTWKFDPTETYDPLSIAINIGRDDIAGLFIAYEKKWQHKSFKWHLIEQPNLQKLWDHPDTDRWACLFNSLTSMMTRIQTVIGMNDIKGIKAVISLDYDFKYAGSVPYLLKRALDYKDSSMLRVLIELGLEKAKFKKETFMLHAAANWCDYELIQHISQKYAEKGDLQKVLQTYDSRGETPLYKLCNELAKEVSLSAAAEETLKFFLDNGSFICSASTTDSLPKVVLEGKNYDLRRFFRKNAGKDKDEFSKISSDDLYKIKREEILKMDSVAHIEKEEITQLLKEALKLKDQDFVSHLVSIGAKPDQECFLIAIDHQLFSVADALLNNRYRVVPLPGSLPKLGREGNFFIKHWLEKIVDASLRLKEAEFQELGIEEAIKEASSVLTIPQKIIYAVRYQSSSVLANLLKTSPRALTSLSSLQVQEVWSVACSRSVEMVQVLIKEGFNLTLKDQEDNSGLHLAAKALNVEVLKYFIQQQMDVNALNKSGLTPLQLVQGKDCDIDEIVSCTQVLLQAEAQGLSSKQFKLIWNKAKSLKDKAYLLDLFQKMPNRVIRYCFKSGGCDTLHWLLSRSKAPITFTAEETDQLLKFAYFNADCLRIIHEQEWVDLNRMDALKNTIFHKAAERQALKVMKYLSSRRISNINVINANQLAAIDILVKGEATSKLCDTILHLIEQGAIVQKSATIQAIWKSFILKHPSQLYKLCERKILAPLTEEGHTPIHFATQYAGTEILRELIGYQCWPVDHPDEYGNTALDLIFLQNWFRIEQDTFEKIFLLLKAGAAVKQAKSHGGWPLLAIFDKLWTDSFNETNARCSWQNNWAANVNSSSSLQDGLRSFWEDKKEMIDTFIRFYASNKGNIQALLHYMDNQHWEENVWYCISGGYTKQNVPYVGTVEKFLPSMVSMTHRKHSIKHTLPKIYKDLKKMA